MTRHLRVLVPTGVTITRYDDWVVCMSAPPAPNRPARGCMWVAVEAFENRTKALSRHKKIIVAARSSACVNLKHENLRLIRPDGKEYVPHT